MDHDLALKAMDYSVMCGYSFFFMTVILTQFKVPFLQLETMDCVLVDVMVRISQQKYPRQAVGYSVGFHWGKKKIDYLSDVVMLGYTRSSFQNV